MNMIFERNGKQVTFEDFVDETKENKGKQRILG